MRKTKNGQSARGILVEDLVEMRMARDKSLSREDALEEVAAYSMESMLTDGTVMELLAEVRQQDAGLWEKIREWFKDLAEDLQRLIKAYQGAKPDSIEGQMVDMMEDMAVVFRAVYTDALNDAGTNFQGAKGPKNTTREGGAVKYDIRYTTDNHPVVVIQENILQGIPEDQWTDAVKNTLEGIKPGIPISGRLIRVNATTAGEYTNSKLGYRLKAARHNIWCQPATASKSLSKMAPP